MKIIPRILPVLLFFVIASAGVHAESLTATFEQGNAQYQRGDYAAAAHSYQRLLDQGVDSGTVYYNLGNACFKQKRLGEAIYYWEKARRKLPGDTDIQENLRFAGLLIVDRIDIPESPLPVRIVSQAAHQFTISQESWILLVLFVFANVLLAVFFLARSPHRASWYLSGILVCCLLMGLFGSSLGWKVYQDHYRREGVVVELKADVRSGPGTDNVTVFTIHEGVLVQVRGESEGWYQVSLPNGWSGWLPGSSLRIL